MPLRPPGQPPPLPESLTMTTTTALGPASQKLLREIAKYDTGNGVMFRVAARARYIHPDTYSTYNQRTFWPLTGNGLVDDGGGNDNAPVRITEDGRKLLAALDAATPPKRPRHAPSAEGRAARRLRREIAEHDQELVHDDGLRRVWRVASRDGHQASIDTWMVLEKAGYIRTERVSSIGGHRASVTAAGRARLAAWAQR
jgi:hypothetical protein